MRARLPALAAALTCAVVTSCSSGPSAGSVPKGGECSLRFRFQGDLYRSAAGLQTPHRGDRIGTAPAVGCDGDTASELGRVELFAVAGQDRSRAVIVAEENGDAVYINDTIPWRDRPQLVKDSERFPTCSRPARFTGIWRYVEPDDMPNGEDYDSVRVPYTADFTTRNGTGVGLRRWASVTLQAEVTSATRPVPSPDFLRRATQGNTPVVVTASCRGGTFVVQTIRLTR